MSQRPAPHGGPRDTSPTPPTPRRGHPSPGTRERTGAPPTPSKTGCTGRPLAPRSAPGAGLRRPRWPPLTGYRWCSPRRTPEPLRSLGCDPVWPGIGRPAVSIVTEGGGSPSRLVVPAVPSVAPARSRGGFRSRKTRFPRAGAEWRRRPAGSHGNPSLLPLLQHTACSHAAARCCCTESLLPPTRLQGAPCGVKNLREKPTPREEVPYN